MIPLRDQEFIRSRFADHLSGSVRLDHFTQSSVDLLAPGRDPCPTCDDARTVIHELAALSDKLKLEEHHLTETDVAAKLGVAHVPATVVRGPNNRALTFYGIPAGNQFPGFVESIVAASHGGFDEERNGIALDAATKQRLKRLRDDIRMVVFVTPSCPYSPQMALLAFALGIECHRIHAEVYEIAEFPRLAQRHTIAGTPTAILNDDIVVAGAINEADMVDQIFRTAQTHGKAGGVVRSRYSTPIETAQPAQRAPERRTPGGLILPGR